MPPPTVLAPGQLGQLRDLSGSYSANTPLEVSAVSWGAILAGAAVAAVMSLVLLILGTGLGLSSVSPWAQEGISASTFGVTAIIWLILTQLVASGMGGYIAGRLRTKWGTAQTDEVYFRDTARLHKLGLLRRLPPPRC